LTHTTIRISRAALRILLLLAAIVGPGAHAAQSGRIPIDQVPMYGGMDRSLEPKLKAADETFIEGVTREFGSREAAARLFTSYAFELYRKDDLRRAMQRFNQAWLLDPKNPDVYWGFASVLHDRGEYCAAVTMFDKALEHGIAADKGFLADAGLIASRCALSDKNLSTDERARMSDRSEQFFQRAEREDPNRPYVYATWARARRDQQRYVEAWQMIARQRSAGGKPNERFLSLLRQDLPEPADK
jgi:tetratricopeptide (TPR) repeat protein